MKRENKEGNQDAKVYEGILGIKAAFNDILTTLKENNEKEYLVFTLGESLGREELVDFFLDYHEKRVKSNIKVRLIAHDNLRNIFSKYYMLKKMNVRYTNHLLPTGVFIYGNKVMTLIWDDRPSAFIIESKNNTERYKKFFEEMWKEAEYFEGLWKRFKQ